MAELLALSALIGLGYVLTKNHRQDKTEEFASYFEEETKDLVFEHGGQPPPIYDTERTAPGAPGTIPGQPRQPRFAPEGQYDQFYQLPTSPQNLLFGSQAMTPSTSLPSEQPQTAVTSQVRMNVPGLEAPPDYNSGKTIISPLTGIPMPTGEFTHNNMQPFFRGSVKQNMTDDANRHTLDNMIGTGFDQIAKREQAPLFDPHREPTGNITGLENMTDFMQDRVIVSTNRAFEKPIESTMVGPGVGQGYSSLPIGGFQQLEVLEVAKRNLSIDELRVTSNPRITYEGVVIPGQAIGTQRGEIGEVRKYHPDKFFMNEHGERNFVTTTADTTRPTTRSSQIMKFQARTETSSEFQGPAMSAGSTETYTVPSFRAPFARQQEGYGYRNADGSTYGVPDTDAPNNDFGASAVEMLANQRNVTSERGQALNLVTAGSPQALTVYDPNDVARTTVRETTGANDWIGGAVGVEAKKLTVYDPTDIARITHRNTNAEVDTALNVTRAGVPGSRTLQFPDGWRNTSKATITANSAYTGPGGLARAKGEQVYDGAYAMRQNGMKELTSAGRAPEYGNGIKPLFNGEDNVNLTYRKITADFLNDRDNTVNRVVGPAAGTEAVGLQRPKQVLQINVAEDRNYTAVLDSLDSNPYALPVFKIAQELPTGLPLRGNEGPAEMGLRSLMSR